MKNKSKYQDKQASRRAQDDTQESRVVHTVTGERHSDGCHASFKEFKTLRDAFLAAKDAFLKTKDALRDARAKCPNCTAFRNSQGFNMGATLGG